MADIKSYLEKGILPIIILILILFEIRLTIVVHEIVIEILFILVNFFLFLRLLSALKQYNELKQRYSR